MTLYTIEWDVKESFENAEVATPLCYDHIFGRCNIASKDMSPPFKFEWCGLDVGTQYFSRVVGRNEVEIQQIYPSGYPKDNSNWSEIMSAVTKDQLPSSPTSIFVHNLGRNSIRVIFKAPLRNGGQSILSYKVEWDISDAFETASSVTITENNLNKLDQETYVLDLIDDENHLQSGTYYYFQVSAINSVGRGETLRSEPIAPTSHPSRPLYGTLTSPVSSHLSHSMATISWEEPIHSGGSNITNYLVEWWSGKMSPEVQIVKLNFAYTPTDTTFSLEFSTSPVVKKETSMLPWNASADLVRRELINLGWNELNDQVLIDDINVERSALSNGFAWSITFGPTKTNSINKGDQATLMATVSPNGDACDPVMSVVTLKEGQRALGQNEVQFLQIIGTGELSGYFRLKFEGSAYSNYISAHATPSEIKTALELLENIGEVEVTQNDATNTSIINENPKLIQHYFITFLSNIGNVGSLITDLGTMKSTTNDVLIRVVDGNNNIGVSGMMENSATPGEKPVDYSNSGLLSSLIRSYTITGLEPGTEYFVSVSAKNSLHGFGERLIPIPQSIVPSKQVPSKPTKVQLSVNNGQNDRLHISYDTPLSDGGDDIRKFRVELDTSLSFNNPIVEYIRCPTDNRNTIWEVKTEINGNDHISGGSFRLKLKYNGVSQLTPEISYDSVALRSQEVGIEEEIIGPYEAVNGSEIIISSSGLSVHGVIFKGDRLKFSGQVTEGTVYEVIEVSEFNFRLSKTFNGVTGIQTSTRRIYGGRGDPLSSRIYCQYHEILCPHSAVTKSGSLQSKIEGLSNIVSDGVTVDRYGPDSQNRFIWRVTFLDKSPLLQVNDFTITPASSSLTTWNGSGSTSIITTLISSGATYGSCIGKRTVPSHGGLVRGLQYYGRVSAANSIGYSLPQSADKPCSPMIPPGPPTGVALTVISASELEVVFGSPSDNGGDGITEYLIEWDTSSTFSNSKSDFINYLAGGSPFTKVISHLSKGVSYFVRVRAKNSQGYGAAQVSTPPFLSPHQKPSSPTGVKLGVTTDTMITVGWEPPLDNGGSEVITYRIEWDINVSFSSNAPPPHKGYIDLDALYHSSYTIDLLSPNFSYFIQVYAINQAGLGKPKQSSPLSARPHKQVPGVPYAVAAESGYTSGSISVSWQPPKIPHHLIPCCGKLGSPNECPSGVGEDNPGSNGGDPILEYEIEVNENSNFNGNEGSRVSLYDSSFVFSNLIKGRLYFVRVLARNSIGSGSFSEPIPVYSST